MKSYKEFSLRILMINVLISVFVSPGFAQEEPVKKPKVHNLSFEDELIEGGLQKPDLFYLIQRKNFSFKKLIRLRENFLPEMRETSDYLREGRSKN